MGAPYPLRDKTIEACMRGGEWKAPVITALYGRSLSTRNTTELRWEVKTMMNTRYKQAHILVVMALNSALLVFDCFARSSPPSRDCSSLPSALSPPPPSIFYLPPFTMPITCTRTTRLCCHSVKVEGPRGAKRSRWVLGIA